MFSRVKAEGRERRGVGLRSGLGGDGQDHHWEEGRGEVLEELHLGSR